MATTIAGITVKFTEFRRLPDEQAGGARRTVSGVLRGDTLWTKKAWEGVAYAVNATEADTLRAAVGPNTAVSVAGDLFHGVTYSAIVQITDDVHVRLPSGFYELLSLSIRQA